MKYLFLSVLLLTMTITYANKIVNVYVWGGEIPKAVLEQFEKETKIHVNFSTYDSNETMYAKLKASHKTIYDVILPSAYYVERMKKQHKLVQLDHSKLPNLHYLDHEFTQHLYDKDNHYSIPLTWGVTGLFYNKQLVAVPPTAWKDLWNPRFRGQLMLLDDSREIFGLTLMRLGYTSNDANPEHIKQAFQALLALIPNIKLFASDGIQAIMIDGDAVVGTTWNGDAVKASAENKTLQFVYPSDGYILWIDCLAIPARAPHLDEAYQFINFLLKPSIAAKIALAEGHPITNSAGKKLLPAHIRNNIISYPPPSILKRSQVQRDLGEATTALYNQYWEQFKLAF